LTTRPKILIVEDEEPLLRLATRILEKQDYHVTAISSPKEALTIFMNKPEEFNLVITDQLMPGLSGIELAEQLLEIRNDIPIILCSGASRYSLGDDYNRIGFSGHITKPYEKKVLISQVQEILAARDVG